MTAFSFRLPDRGSRAALLCRAAQQQNEDEHRFKKRRRVKMSTTLTPAIDMKKLNALIGQFVTDLGTAAHTGMVSLGKNWDFTKPSPVARYLLKRKKLQLQGLQQSEFVIPPFSLELIRHAA